MNTKTFSVKLTFFNMLAAVLLLASCGKKDATTETVRDSLALNYTTLRTLPHDTKAFTEGLLVHGNKILESTGMNGESWVAEVDPGTGEHNKKIILDNQYFGEGIAVLNNKLYQLTYKTMVGFIYDARTYKQIGEFTYKTEGWGMTHDNKNLIMSDGSDKLYYLDTTSLAVTRTLPVTLGGQKLRNINELEYVDGFIFANVYETSMVVKIDAATGRVVGRIDFSSLVQEMQRMYPNVQEMNGIAYDKNSGAFLVTGKYWPKAFLIKIGASGVL